MNLFQALVLPLLTLLIMREAFAWRRRGEGWLPLVRGLAWTLAAVMIAQPAWTVTLATPLGIQRGSDLVFYLFMLASLGTTLYFYSRQERLSQRVRSLARELALRDARWCGAEPRGERSE